MNNKFRKYKKFIDMLSVGLLVTCFFFCNSVFAEKFNAVIKNDTEETLVISNVVKNYSRFDEDSKIEDMQKLEPAQKTQCFSVNMYGSSYLKSIEEGNDLDGFYLESNNEKIGVVWGKILDTGLTPIFGPLTQAPDVNKMFKVEISIDGPSQNPLYIFTIKKTDSKF